MDMVKSGKKRVVKVGIYTNADDIVATTGISNEEAAVFCG